MRWAAAFIPLVAASPALADVNLVAKREACHAEARQRIKPRGATTGELARALIEKRQRFTDECVDRPVQAALPAPQTTGTVKTGTVKTAPAKR
ncbi:MAG TPA: hypothetical protein VGU45_07975 [Microvirga sp.]|jgi:hypothetical protein|nr:hypothetical protein [Microvirga sp.]